jgi:hypothetical protein
MANIRNRVTANNAENNGENNNNQDANLPPPPPPTLEHVLAMQAQMLQTMVNLHAQPKLLHHRGIGLEIFSAPSHQPFLMLWS